MKNGGYFIRRIEAWSTLNKNEKKERCDKDSHLATCKLGHHLALIITDSSLRVSCVLNSIACQLFCQLFMLSSLEQPMIHLILGLSVEHAVT